MEAVTPNPAIDRRWPHKKPRGSELHIMHNRVELLVCTVDHKVLFRRAAEYVDKILNGARPEDLPIEQRSQFVLVVNLGTARALGLSIPESIVLRAAEIVD